MNVLSRPSHRVALAALLVFSGTIGFAAVRPEYRHIAQTISELGARGTAYFRLVGWGVFLPSGLLVWWALWGLRGANTVALLAFASLGLGYVGAALFPCDPGSPIWGSARQQIHNLVGAIEYLGTGAGFFLMSRRAARPALWICAGLLAWVGLVLLGSPSLFAFRGAIQRVIETTLFVGTYCAVRSLERR